MYVMTAVHVLPPHTVGKAFPSVSCSYGVLTKQKWFNLDWVSKFKTQNVFGDSLVMEPILGLYDYIPLITYSQKDIPASYQGEKWLYQSSMASEDKTLGNRRNY